MLRHSMGGQLLEQQLMHGQAQDGMHPGLQLGAGLAGEVRYGEVQAALPAQDVGDAVGDLTGVPAALIVSTALASIALGSMGLVSMALASMALVSMGLLNMAVVSVQGTLLAVVSTETGQHGTGQHGVTALAQWSWLCRSGEVWSRPHCARLQRMYRTGHARRAS